MRPFATTQPAEHAPKHEVEAVMKLEFFGPLGRVTGSSALLSDERLGVRILVDAGIQQGEGEDDRWNRGPLPFDAAALTHIVLTHAHIDHCGLLPRVVKDGFKGAVVCTPETAALARIQLEDSARVSGDYSVDDARRVRFDTRDAAFGTYFPIARDVFLQFFRTAHILGAVAVRFSWGPKGPAQRSIIFSGDLGTNVDGHERFLLLRHRMAPPPSNYAVVESTYGDRERTVPGESFVGRVEGLRRELRSGVGRGGTTLVAVFAMDRLQTMMLDISYVAGLDAEIARTPVFVHAPLGRRISSVYAKFVSAKDICRTGVRSRWLSKAAFSRFGLDPDNIDHERQLEDAIVAVLDPDAKTSSTLPGLPSLHQWIDRTLVPTGPAVVLASSGMLEGGTVVSYLRAVLTDPASTIILAGYAAPTTVAGKLLKIGGLTSADRQRLPDVVELPDGTSLPSASVRAHITAASGYSGHADQRGIVDWLVHEHEGKRCLAGQAVFIQHGTEAGRDGLRRVLGERAPEVAIVCPTPENATYDLEAPAALSREAELLARIAELEARLCA
jgi:metallo-beta-lactamase family protein